MDAWGATSKNDEEDKDKPEIENSWKMIRLYNFFPCFFHYKMIKCKDLVFLWL